VFATSQPANIQRIPGVCSAFTRRWSVAPRACPASVWRVHLCVELRAQKSRRTKRMATNENRWSSALDERLTNDDEQRVRSSCVLHASTRCDRALTEHRRMRDLDYVRYMYASYMQRRTSKITYSLCFVPSLHCFLSVLVKSY